MSASQMIISAEVSRPDASAERIAVAESVWGSYLVALERYQEAETYLLASYHLLYEVKGEQNPCTRDAARRAAALYEAWGREDEAAAYRAAADKGTGEITGTAPSS